MAKANIREIMKKSVNGVLFMDDDEVSIAIEGFDSPMTFQELFAQFEGKEVKIDIGVSSEHKPE